MGAVSSDCPVNRRLPPVGARLGRVLLARTKRLPARVDYRLVRQAALLNAAHVVTSDLSFDSVIRRLVEEVVALLRADAADCWIFEPGRDLLRCRAVLGVPDSNVGRLLPPEGTIGKAIETGHPVLTHDFAE